jgi:hypothetical protein
LAESAIDSDIRRRAESSGQSAARLFGGRDDRRRVAACAELDVIGAWCFWNHPTEGPFAGIIDDDPSDIGNGTIALSATGLGHALLIDRITPVLIQPDTGHAGALATPRAFVCANRGSVAVPVRDVRRVRTDGARRVARRIDLRRAAEPWRGKQIKSGT